jgi:hypothetical protein
MFHPLLLGPRAAQGVGVIQLHHPVTTWYILPSSTTYMQSGSSPPPAGRVKKRIVHNKTVFVDDKRLLLIQ